MDHGPYVRRLACFRNSNVLPLFERYKLRWRLRPPISGRLRNQLQPVSGRLTNCNMAGLLLVVLQGDFDHDRPTKQQLNSLDRLVAWLAAKHGLDPKEMSKQISGHKEHQYKVPVHQSREVPPGSGAEAAAALRAR